MLQGRPIGQPVAQYGPFVMNEEDEIAEAFADYRRTGFGGWPWASDDPVHGGRPGPLRPPRRRYRGGRRAHARSGLTTQANSSKRPCLITPAPAHVASNPYLIGSIS